MVAVCIVSDTGNVVGQRIQPNVSYVLWIEGNRNSPCKGSSGNTQILESRKKEVVHHLVLSAYRLNKFRMVIDMLNQTICILAHFKEVCFFGSLLYRASAVRALSVHKLRFCPEAFIRYTVPAFVRTFINVALIVELLKDLLNLLLVIFISGTNKFIMRGIHKVPNTLYLVGNLVHVFLRCNAFFFGFFFNFLTVFIGSCLEKYIISFLSAETSDCICQHDFIGISYMRLTGCVGNRGGHVVWSFICHVYSPIYTQMRVIHSRKSHLCMNVSEIIPFYAIARQQIYTTYPT